MSAVNKGPLSWKSPSLYKAFLPFPFTSNVFPIILEQPEVFKFLRSPGIDSKESIPPAYVAWRADKTTPFQLGS
jgi:hypothetical protein